MIIWILGYAAIAAVLWFWLLPQKRRDWWKSDRQRIHLPPGEKNLWSRGADGYFDRKKAYRNFAIYVGGPLVGGTIVQFFWPGSLFVIAGLFGLFGLLVKMAIRKDITDLNADIESQRDILNRLRSVPDANWIGNIKPLGYGKQKAWVADTFYDFAVIANNIPYGEHHWPPDEYEAAQAAAKEVMLPRIAELAREIEPAKWFEANRSKLV